MCCLLFAQPLSLSARRAWIEIKCRTAAWFAAWSLSARRAWIEIKNAMEINGSHGVALRKESVDRNRKWVTSEVLPSMSLSARRAWIEIALRGTSKNIVPVALRKESVDRNRCRCLNCGKIVEVALRKESVDRNCPTWQGIGFLRSRSPQGERG